MSTMIGLGQKAGPNYAQKYRELSKNPLPLKYQKISKDIEEYRKRKGPENFIPTEEIFYFLHFLFDCGRLHTVDVTYSIIL
jgi:hypothetical protein